MQGASGSRRRMCLSRCLHAGASRTRCRTPSSSQPSTAATSGAAPCRCARQNWQFSNCVPIATSGPAANIGSTAKSGSHAIPSKPKQGLFAIYIM